MNIQFCKLHPNAVVPEWKTEGSVGADLSIIGSYTLLPYQTTMLHTGLSVKPPPGFHTKVYLRSSFGLKFPGVYLANHVGIIDEDYCGPEDELKILLYNTTETYYNINSGLRVAQIVVEQTFKPTIIVVESDTLLNVSRDGFGSTGGM